MLVQPISNNYQAPRTQKVQKQNNISFGAIITYGEEARSIQLLGRHLKQLKINAIHTQNADFFDKALKIFVRSLRSIAEHNRNPENHRLFNNAIPVREISFEAGDVVWLSNHNLSPVVATRYKAPDYPETAKMVIKTETGLKVEVPFSLSPKKIAQTGGRIQDVAIEHLEDTYPNITVSEYLQDPVQGRPIGPVKIEQKL